MTESLSLLAKATPPRDLPIALAHCYVTATTPERLALLNRLHRRLSPAAQQQCVVAAFNLGEKVA